MHHDHPPREPVVPRRAVLAGMVALATLAGGAMVAAQPRGLRAPAIAGEAPAAGLWVSATPLDDGRQLLVVIDPSARNAAVYHLDAAAGTLTLRSTRNIAWDLLVGEYNVQEPRPSALKRLVEGGDGAPIGGERPGRP